MVYIKIVWFVVSHGSAIPPYDETNYTDIPEYKNDIQIPENSEVITSVDWGCEYNTAGGPDIGYMQEYLQNLNKRTVKEKNNNSGKISLFDIGISSKYTQSITKENETISNLYFSRDTNGDNTKLSAIVIIYDEKTKKYSYRYDRNPFFNHGLVFPKEIILLNDWDSKNISVRYYGDGYHAQLTLKMVFDITQQLINNPAYLNKMSKSIQDFFDFSEFSGQINKITHSYVLLSCLSGAKSVKSTKKSTKTINTNSIGIVSPRLVSNSIRPSSNIDPNIILSIFKYAHIFNKKEQIKISGIKDEVGSKHINTNNRNRNIKKAKSKRKRKRNSKRK